MELHLALLASPLPAADPGRRPPPPRGNFATNSTASIINTHLSREIFRSLDSWTEHNLLAFLKPVEKCWQPQDFLPDPSRLSPAELGDAVREMQERVVEIPDEVWVCMVGNMVTEEALPTYQSFMSLVLNGGTGEGSNPWERWIGGWSAEENRHGDLLNKYLYLTGRLDMRQVEKTIQYLIGGGMDIGVGDDPFLGVMYTCFQEKATFISHGNTARLAKHHGDTTLAKICGLVAADEKRHAAAYTSFMRKLFEVDPNQSMLAFAHIMRARVTMPASRMFDGSDPHLFTHFSAVSQKIGVYSVEDYGEMLDFFLKEWEISDVGDGLSPEGRRAQEYVCGLPEVMRKMAERADDRRKKMVKTGEPRYIPFSWIFNKQVCV